MTSAVSLANEENTRMGAQGQRVMVVARRDFDPATFDPAAPHLDDVRELELLAMVGIVDPPRAEAKVAIEQCHRAGIEVRMITGDHAVTAAAIGHELGITGKALTGAEFAAMSDEQLIAELDDIGVVARVSPEDKIRLVSTLQGQSNVVAMTGDGVNDAPALKKADIGVAMGITGTEVSKDAAVMILTDDNFATIVRAVEYGRQLYDNLAKYIRFQMAALVAFIATYLGAALFQIADGIPFAPLAVLWINFAVQVPLALALGFDRPVEGLMDKPPRPLHQPVLSRAQWGFDIALGIVMAIETLWVLEVFEDRESAIVAASMAVAVFSLMNVALALGARSATETALDRDSISGRRQLLLYGLALLFTLLSTELGILQRILGTTSLSGGQWLLCIALAAGLLLVGEVIKLILRRRGSDALLSTGDLTTAPRPAPRSNPRVRLQMARIRAFLFGELLVCEDPLIVELAELAELLVLVGPCRRRRGRGRWRWEARTAGWAYCGCAYSGVGRTAVARTRILRRTAVAHTAEGPRTAIARTRTGPSCSTGSPADATPVAHRGPGARDHGGASDPTDQSHQAAPLLMPLPSCFHRHASNWSSASTTACSAT